jgi:DNA-binding transcriptional regulator YiaG
MPRMVGTQSAPQVVELDADERALMRHRRKQLRRPAKAVARKIGCSVSALFSWETGDRRPRRAAYEAWRRALGESL